MRTVSQILDLSASFLQAKKVSRPRRLAEELLAHILSCKRIDLYLRFDLPLVSEEEAAMREGVERLGFGHPIEYIMGEVEFYGCRIRIDPRVLIPRPETEILVDLVAKRALQGVLWDLCAGSGCIGIALKRRCPDLVVSLSDLSGGAVALAADNARLNNAEIEILEGDLLCPFFGKKADWIICNPPYIASAEYSGLDPSVKDFEPRMALIGGERGTEFYERLAAEAPAYLRDEGRLVLEIGASQGRIVKEIFSSPVWSKQELFSDWSGKDRFFFLEKQ